MEKQNDKIDKQPDENNQQLTEGPFPKVAFKLPHDAENADNTEAVNKTKETIDRIEVGFNTKGKQGQGGLKPEDSETKG